MWSPTHVQVVVHRAKGLLTKGKNKTNDCFVTIALGKEKYQTSVKEKASENVDWHEECELAIPQQGNTAEIVLTALHRNFLGVDEFLGTVRIPLASFDIYEMPKNRWYELTGKPGKTSTKERGRLEVRVGFIVRAGSLTDLTKKERHKSSLGQLSSAAQSFGGSLLSIGSADKRKGQLKKLAKSIGSKVKGKSRSKAKLDDICDEDDDDGVGVGGGGGGELRRPRPRPRTTGQEHGDADPGVVSDDDDFTFDDLSHKSSNSSLNSSRTAPAWKQSGSLTRDSGSPQLGVNRSRTDSESSKHTPPSKPPRFALNTTASNPANNSSSGKTSTPSSQQQQPQQQQQSVEDEWGKKLYGLQAGNALKRWENKRSSPKVAVEEVRDSRQEVANSNNTNANKIVSNNNANNTSNNSAINEDSPIARLRGEISAAVNEAKQSRKDKDKYKVNVVRGDANDSKKDSKKDKSLHKSSSERIIIGGEESQASQLERLPRELIEQFDGKSREELIEQIVHLQLDVADKKKRLNDLEDYIDALLLRVIESSPKLLQNPYPPGSRRLSSPGHQ